MSKPHKFRATVRERILIHLLDYTKQRHSSEVPPEVTQAGITDVVSGTRSHVSMVLASMIDSGLIEESLSHISGEMRRKKTYFMTAKGLGEAKEIRGRLLSETVQVFIDGKMHEARISELDDLLGETYYLVDILVSVDEGGVLNMETLTGQKTTESAIFTSPLLQVQCPRCTYNFLVQPESEIRDTYTICPSCSSNVHLASQSVFHPPSERVRPSSPGPVYVAAIVLIAMAMFQFLATYYFCFIFLGGIGVVVALLAAGFSALREDTRQSRMAIWAFGTSLGVYLAITVKVFLTRTLETELYAYSFLIFAVFFALVLLPTPIPKAVRGELAISGGVTVSLIGGAIAFLPGILPPNQFHAPVWLILGFAAFIFGYETAHPVGDIRPSLFAGVGVSILVLTGAVVWQSAEPLSIQEALVAVMWTALGVFLVSTRLLQRVRGWNVEDAVVSALPLALGLFFVVIGILVITQELFAVGGFELVIGIPLIIWSVSRVSRTRWKTWLSVYVYAIATVLVSFWVLFYAAA